MPHLYLADPHAECVLSHTSFILCPPRQLSKPRTWKRSLTFLSLPHPQIQSANLFNFISQSVFKPAFSSASWHWLLEVKASTLLFSANVTTSEPASGLRHQKAATGNLPKCNLSMAYSQSLKWIPSACSVDSPTFAIQMNQASLHHMVPNTSNLTLNCSLLHIVPSTKMEPLSSSSCSSPA